MAEPKPPLAAQGSVPGGEPAANPKLSSHLQDLVRAVPQQFGSHALREVSPASTLASATLPKSVRDAIQGRMMRIDSAGDVQVYMLVNHVTAANLMALRDQGAKIERHDDKLGIIQAHVPVNRIEAIADLPFVKFVRTPNYAVYFTGSVDSEGDGILKADQVRQDLHVDGSGVTVGVISDGIKGIFATGCTTCGPTTASISPIESGDLPASTGTRNSSGVLVSTGGGITAKSFACTLTQDGSSCGLTAGDLEAIQPGCAFPGAGAEGTAVMEVVDDMAPKVNFYFANAATDLDFVEAVNYIGQHADIGLDDVGFVGLPYNGSSDVSQASSGALNSATGPLRGYFTSVGNFADDHYYSLYTDSGQNFVSPKGVSGDLNLFQSVSAATATADHPVTNDALGLGALPYDVIKLNPGGEAVIFLSWDDPYTDSTNNYDLFLVEESTGAVVASSTSVQSTANPSQPVEYIDYINSTGSQNTFHILVQNVNNAAAAKHLNMFIFSPECAASGPLRLDNTTLQDHNFNTYPLSVVAESDAGGSPVSVTSVGATGDILSCLSGSCQPVTTASSTTIEPYSSNGPTLDGRTKPDISAVDGVSVTGAGSFENPFFGTSASTPHVGGIAALLVQAASCLKSGAAAGSLYTTPAQQRQALRNLLLNHADPLPAGGTLPNDIYGYGLVDALNSASNLVPAANAGAAQIVAGNAATGANLQLDGSGSTDPTGCPLTYDWSGSCGTVSSGTAKSTVTCPFGTNTESLVVTNNGVTFSSAASVQITVTDFTVAASPSSATVSAGSSASFTITASPQPAPYSGAIAFSCTGFPRGAACSFSPANLTPGSNPVTTTLTISTTARSATPPLGPAPRAPLGLWLGLAALAALTLAGALHFMPIPPAPNSARRLALGLISTAFALWLLIAVACGGGSSSPPPPPPGTPAGTYNISVTGANGSLMHSAAATLVVQ